jgi:hypothetical protein
MSANPAKNVTSRHCYEAIVSNIIQHKPDRSLIAARSIEACAANK